MADSNVLKASVQLDVKKATRSLDQLYSKINKIQRVVGQANNSSANISRNLQRVTTSANNSASAVTRSAKSMDKASKSASVLTKNLRTLISTYVGLMGVKAVVNASDTITSAENKLNQITGNPEMTQATMDKMYAASQNARVGYGDMMANVSKSMTLAPDSFQGDIDNAIRFQEIMGKAYTLGGASAAEMSSSMYQMIQALGSGKLAGDELRSVTEGAPLAAKMIEKFAQEVYGTTDALKDMGSQGLITSDIVVAAMMAMGDEIDQKFEETKMTFAQAWQSIKNDALKAFEPVLQMLNMALNTSAGQSIVSGIGTALTVVANILIWVFTLIGNVYNFIVDNWEVISKVLLTIATIMAAILLPKFIAWLSYLGFIAAYYIYVGALAVAAALKAAAAWAIANLPLFLIIVILAAIVVALIWVSDSFADACGIIVGVLMGAASVIWNIFVTLLTAILKSILLPLFQAWDNFANFFANVFNDPISTIIKMFEGLADNVLSICETIAKGIDAIFGSNLADAVSGWRNNLSASADLLVNKYGNGTYKEKSAMADKVDALLSNVSENMLWNTSDAYNTGYKWGEAGGNWITDKVSSIGSMLTGGGGLGNFSGLADNLGAGFDTSKVGQGIADDTGSMADSMELAEEDLEYLRKVADMEWKKEFTTAAITVDMTGMNNTINNKGDLDGWVTQLADKLYEELDMVANGVYA